MISQSTWELMQAVRIVILVCFLPVLLYRLWRIVRHPASVPAIAATTFGLAVWFWFLVYTDGVWAVLPPSARAVSVVGWPAITIAACVQIFVVGIKGNASPERLRRGLWLTFAVAAIALVVVVVAVSHGHPPSMEGDVLTISNALYAGDDIGLVLGIVVSSGYVMFVFLQLAWAGFRNADKTPVGVGLGLMAVASVFQVVASFCGGVWGPLSRGEGFMGGAAGVWLRTWPGSVAACLIVAGFLWPPVTLRVLAWQQLRRLRPLRDALGGAFPRLFPPMESRTSLPDLAFEWMTHIQDGLTLLAQSRAVPIVTDFPARRSESERALAVVNWLVGRSVPGFSCEWLHAPDGISDEAWVLAIASAYRERQEGLEAPASLSGMPSTLRR